MDHSRDDRYRSLDLSLRSPPVSIFGGMFRGKGGGRGEIVQVRGFGNRDRFEEGFVMQFERERVSIFRIFRLFGNLFGSDCVSCGIY